MGSVWWLGLGMTTGEFRTGHPYPIPVPKYLIISHPIPNSDPGMCCRGGAGQAGLGSFTCLTINCQFLTLEHKTNWACRLWSRPRRPNLYIIVQDQSEAFISITSFVPYGPNIKLDYGRPLAFL